jgi:hypothetical protein
MKARFFSVLLGLVVPAAALVPAPVSPQTVDQNERTESEIVAGVQRGNLALLAARTGAEAAAERPGQVRWPFPMVEAMPMLGMIADGEPGAQLMVRQAIPWPARLAADRDARTRRRRRFEAEALELELVRMARTAYGELWGLQEQDSLIRGYLTQLACSGKRR